MEHNNKMTIVDNIFLVLYHRLIFQRFSFFFLKLICHVPDLTCATVQYMYTSVPYQILYWAHVSL